jgi:V/A-type H+-transporting ATPase subunit I
VLSPEPMQKLTLVVLLSDLERVTRAIGEAGVLHLLDIGQSSERPALIQPYDVRQRVTELEDLTQRLDSIAGFFGIALHDAVLSPDLDTPVDWTHVQARTAALADEAAALRARSLRVNADRGRLQAMQRHLRALAPVGIPLQELRELRYVTLTSGLMPDRNLARLRESLTGIPHLLTPMGTVGNDGRVLISVLCLRPDAELLRRALRSAQLEPIEVPAGLDGAPDEVSDQLEADLDRQRQAASALDDERRTLGAAYASEVRSLYALVSREQILADARGRMGRSERIALIGGWVPAIMATSLERALRTATNGRFVLHWTAPATIDGVRSGHVSVPILLRNPLLVRPFERLLRSYGLPRYGEIEPTGVFALTFLTMFGFMFGDVGQGAVLFIIGYFIYRRMFRYRDYAVILMECGFFAVIFGFLYGSIFGIEDWLPALWLRPLHDTGRLMQAAIVFGGLLLSFGLLLNLLNAFRTRDVTVLWERNGLLAAIAYWVAIGLLIRYVTAGPGAVTLGTAALWLALPIVLLLAKEPVLALRECRRARRWPTTTELMSLAVRSVVEVLDAAITTISNTATFIRLAAFALSHAGLFLATFSVADAVARSGAGTIGAVLVIVVGNAIIIALEGLIVSIQGVRLEYYEFFSKFYSGGGEEYRPLRIVSSTAGLRKGGYHDRASFDQTC